jgi:hypothetical protein
MHYTWSYYIPNQRIHICQTNHLFEGRKVFAFHHCHSSKKVLCNDGEKAILAERYLVFVIRKGVGAAFQPRIGFADHGWKAAPTNQLLID